MSTESPASVLQVDAYGIDSEGYFAGLPYSGEGTPPNRFLVVESKGLPENDHSSHIVCIRGKALAPYGEVRRVGTDTGEVLGAVGEYQPTVVIVYDNGGGNQFDLIREIKTALPDAQVLFEYLAPTRGVVETGRLAYRAGADLVLQTHTVVSEFVKGYKREGII